MKDVNDRIGGTTRVHERETVIYLPRELLVQSILTTAAGDLHWSGIRKAPFALYQGLSRCEHNSGVFTNTILANHGQLFASAISPSPKENESR
jgi:hypothetical protein